MIRPTPTSLPGRILSRIVALPGEETADTLADLAPVAGIRAPLVPRGWPAPGACALRVGAAAPVSRVGTPNAIWRALGRLVEARLVQRRDRPAVAPWFAERAAKVGTETALRAILQRDLLARGVGGDVGSVSDYVALLAAVEKGPGSGGQAKVRWATLCRLGVVVAGRWPTEAGVELALGWRGCWRVKSEWHRWAA